MGGGGHFQPVRLFFQNFLLVSIIFFLNHPLLEWGSKTCLKPFFAPIFSIFRFRNFFSHTITYITFYFPNLGATLTQLIIFPIEKCLHEFFFKLFSCSNFFFLFPLLDFAFCFCPPPPPHHFSNGPPLKKVNVQTT